MAKRSVTLSRDTILFVLGLAGIGWETVVQNADRPTLLLVFGAMVGLPAFLNVDEKRKANAAADSRPVTTAPPPPASTPEVKL